MTNADGPLPLATDVQTVKELIDGGHEFLLLDCREKDEHEFVRLEQATLIPMSELESRREELESHRQSHIIVMCHIGGRSQRVTQWLRALGFPQVQNMSGGIDAWAAEIDPALPRY